MIQFWRALFCYCWMPLYFGGDSSSDSSTQTTNDVKNYATDNTRQLSASDAAVTLSGDWNRVDRSTTSTTNFSDSSNRSTNFADSSNRSTNISVTDFGSVGAALGGMGQMTGLALNATGTAVNGVIGAMNKVSADSQKSVASAFSAASASSANALTTSANVLGFASATIDKTNAAFAAAKDGGASKTVQYALIAAGAIGVAFALKS